MNNQVHSALSGTQTEQNLSEAFENKAKSHMKTLLFSEEAERNEDPVTANILREISQNEKQHAELWMGYSGELGHDVENLEALLAAKEYSANVSYPEYAAVADEEGFSEIAEKMRCAANAEAGHAQKLEEHIANIKNGTRFDSDEDSVWHCTNCGYNHVGSTAPERCPLCSHSRNYYVKTV